jgi:hypothetical protein
MSGKLTSRKFWVAILGVVTGIVLVVSGNVHDGTVAIISSVLGYLAAEGYIDAKNADAVFEVISDVKDKMEGEPDENS